MSPFYGEIENFTDQIPWLELRGAVLAVKLLHFVHETTKVIIPIDAMHAWTDSTIILVLIHSSPHRWTTFIANRTSQLQSLTPQSLWRYVPTNNNTVDCASRGLYSTELAQHPMWWNGPAFLFKGNSIWPPRSILLESNLTQIEEKRIILLTTTSLNIFDRLFLKYSSL